MSVMPVPHFQTLYLCRGQYQPNEITLADLGRLHFTASERKALVEDEKKRKREMAFKLVDRSSLPVPTKGKEAATAPRLGVSAGGQMVMNSFINKIWEAAKVVKIAILLDADSGKMLLAGLAEGQKFPVKGYDEKNAFTPTVSKPDEKTKKGGGEYKIAATSLLKEAGYDYAKCGNQSYDATWDDKYKGFVFTLNKNATPKPVAPRKAKTVVPATAGVPANGAPPVPVAPIVEAPADDELVLD